MAILRAKVTRTDADGHFAFTAAPNDCYLQVSPYTADGHSLDLRGWSPPFPVNGDHVELRLHPAGSVKILLPNAISQVEMVPVGESAEVFPNDSNKYIGLTFDPAAHALVTPSAAPGTYVFHAPILPALGVAAGESIQVVAGKETLLDWRNRPLANASPETWCTVHVFADGKPVSGAQVAVFTEKFPVETVTQWIKDWQYAATPPPKPKPSANSSMPQAPPTISS